VAWNPTHPELLCSSSSRDKRVAFYDARRASCSSDDKIPSSNCSEIETRPTQVISLPRRPVSLQYSPDAKNIMVVDEEDRLMFIKHGNTGPEGQSEWKAGETARSAEGGVVSHCYD